MSIELSIDIISNVRTLIGFSYIKGIGKYNETNKIYHEFGIGLLFLSIYIICYKKEES